MKKILFAFGILLLSIPNILAMSEEEVQEKLYEFPVTFEGGEGYVEVKSRDPENIYNYSDNYINEFFTIYDFTPLLVTNYIKYNIGDFDSNYNISWPVECYTNEDDSEYCTTDYTKNKLLLTYSYTNDEEEMFIEKSTILHVTYDDNISDQYDNELISIKDKLKNQNKKYGYGDYHVSALSKVKAEIDTGINLDSNNYKNKLFLYEFNDLKRVIEQYKKWDIIPSDMAAQGGPMYFNPMDAFLFIYRNGYIYDAVNVVLTEDHVLYVDKDASGSLAEKGKKLLQNFLGSNINVSIVEVTNPVLDNNEYVISELCPIVNHDLGTNGKFYNGPTVTYLISSKDFSYNYNFTIIETDKKNVSSFEIRSKDFTSNIEIKTNDSKLFFDLLVNGLNVSEEEYVLKFSNDNKINCISAWDISIIRGISKENISNFENNIEVYIPIDGYDNGKKLKIYYVRDDSTIGEEKIGTVVTVNNNKFLKFLTNHFSTYAISNEVIEELVAPTAKLNADNNKLTISWNNQDAAKKYYVYKSTNNKKWTKLGPVTDTKYIAKSLTYNKTYYYKVRACDETKCSGYSNIVKKKIVPNKVNLKYSSSSTNNIIINWDKVNTTGYEVYRSTDNKKWGKITTITNNTTLKYNNKKLTANKTYYYKVRSYKLVGKNKVYGKWSSVLSTKTAPLAPKATISLRDYNALNIKVSSVKGATKYLIYRSTSKTGSYKKVGQITSGTYKDIGLITGKTYYYKARSCNSQNNCSSWSNIVYKKVTTKAPGLTLSTTSNKVIITLTSVNGADGYVIYRATSEKGRYTLVKTLTSLDELIYDDKTKKGKTYYYKVRSYKMNEDKKVSSPFSKIKSIKSK